jgi:hypothetical protein
LPDRSAPAAADAGVRRREARKPGGKAVGERKAARPRATVVYRVQRPTATTRVGHDSGTDCRPARKRP